MRTLAVDALRMVGPRTAQGRLVEHLAYEWSRMSVPFDRVVLMAPEEVAVPPLGSTTDVTVEVFGSRGPFLVWEQVALPLRARSASILFCPTYVGPLRTATPMVVANHGIYERMPDEFSRIQRLRSTTLHRLTTRRADGVIANSLNTRTDVAEFFGLPENAIDVVYPAPGRAFVDDKPPAAIEAERERVLGSTDPFFIFVGKLSRRRHVPELVEAFARLRETLTQPYRLVVIGPNTTGTDVPRLAAAHGVGDSVLYLSHLEQEALALLYAGALAFVLPTTYEGISYTMFEAMASGTPVVTVDHPTIHEIDESAALVLPSPSVADIFDGLELVATDAALRKKLSERGRACAAEYTWTRNAEETMAILDRVALPIDHARGGRRKGGRVG
jgi:alpha-1,3-rhamnosyl/mannosyltransferase